MFADYIWARLAVPGWITATVMLSELRAWGYTGSHSILRAFMAGLRPVEPPNQFAPRVDDGKLRFDQCRHDFIEPFCVDIKSVGKCFDVLRTECFIRSECLVGLVKIEVISRSENLRKQG
jgi:hypothetical protein